MLFSVLWESCPCLNRDREGVNGEAGRWEWGDGRRERGELWSVCKVNKKNVIKLN